MFIAQDKLKNNIAEYIIYMYQIEDLIRAYQFDIEKIKKEIILPQTPNPSLQQEAVEWYKTIIRELKERNLEHKGHLYRINEVITELIYLHNTLKDVVKDKKIIELLHHAQESVDAFKKKSNLTNEHLIEVCFHALYMKLLLKLKGEQISGESEKAFDEMRVVLAYLTKAYHKMKAGDMSIFEKNE